MYVARRQSERNFQLLQPPKSVRKRSCAHEQPGGGLKAVDDEACQVGKVGNGGKYNPDVGVFGVMTLFPRNIKRSEGRNGENCKHKAIGRQGTQECEL